MRSPSMLKVLSLICLSFVGVNALGQPAEINTFKKNDVLLSPEFVGQSMQINSVNDRHIQREQLKLKNQFQRNSWLRNGLTVSALGTAGAMFYWWSNSNLRPTLGGDQQDFLGWFNDLEEEKKYDLLMSRLKDVDSLSIKSLFRKLVPYAVGSAASSLLLNSVQMILMQPLSRAVNKLYFQVDLGWFVSTRSNILDLFNALESSTNLIEKDLTGYHSSLFIDTANDLIFQIERVLAFMQYQIDNLDAPDNRTRSIGLRAVRRIKDICFESVTHLNESFSKNEVTSISDSLKKLKSEFNTAVKQFKVFESACS